MEAGTSAMILQSLTLTLFKLNVSGHATGRDEIIVNGSSGCAVIVNGSSGSVGKPAIFFVSCRGFPTLLPWSS